MMLLNLVLCLVIVVVGLLAYQKKNDLVIILVVGAFALFGVSHLASLLGVEQAYETILLVLRTIGYILVIVAVSKAAMK